MAGKTAAVASIVIALCGGAGPTARAVPPSSYHPNLDACLTAMSNFKTGRAECVYIAPIDTYVLRVQGG
ncbi:hypothetical protein OH799_20685 [Nocardia sp. NBC_00881]|uniref:hypothetical protein n=1 Tax=Nocardia sp. NBC_00881 TaxID=2975995 RepID=UPI00386A8868|nr:hypothetical protein OH799_20685 [Nocardia sp. NBC_00881]